MAAAKRQEAAAVQELHAVKLEHAAACASLREQAVQLQERLQSQSEADKAELTRNHRAMEAQLSKQIEELRQRLEAVSNDKTRFEGDAKQLHTRLTSLELELTSCKQDLGQVRAENKELDRCRHENLKTIQAHEVGSLLTP